MATAKFQAVFQRKINEFEIILFFFVGNNLMNKYGVFLDETQFLFFLQVFEFVEMKTKSTRPMHSSNLMNQYQLRLPK